MILRRHKNAAGTGGMQAEGHKKRDISRVRVATAAGGKEGDKKTYQWPWGFRWKTEG
jgi:hypothetical protein